jgi:hypothetical protein
MSVQRMKLLSETPYRYRNVRLVFNFSCVCPEPVLANARFYKNTRVVKQSKMAQKTEQRFRTVPGTVTPEPKPEPRECVQPRAFPAASMTSKCVVDPPCMRAKNGHSFLAFLFDCPEPVLTNDRFSCGFARRKK